MPDTVNVEVSKEQAAEMKKSQQSSRLTGKVKGQGPQKVSGPWTIYLFNWLVSFPLVFSDLLCLSGFTWTAAEPRICHCFFLLWSHWSWWWAHFPEPSTALERRVKNKHMSTWRKVLLFVVMKKRVLLLFLVTCCSYSNQHWRCVEAPCVRVNEHGDVATAEKTGTILRCVWSLILHNEGEAGKVLVCVCLPVQKATKEHGQLWSNDGHHWRSNQVGCREDAIDDGHTVETRTDWGGGGVRNKCRLIHTHENKIQENMTMWESLEIHEKWGNGLHEQHRCGWAFFTVTYLFPLNFPSSIYRSKQLQHLRNEWIYSQRFPLFMWKHSRSCLLKS